MAFGEIVVLLGLSVTLAHLCGRFRAKGYPVAPLVQPAMMNS